MAFARFDDFRGGITDNASSRNPTQYTVADNLFVTEEGRLRQRPGIQALEAQDSRFSPGNAVDQLIDYSNGEVLLGVSGGQISYLTPGSGWTAIVGPVDGNPAMQASSPGRTLHQGQWNNHIFVTNDEDTSVRKLYLDDLGQWQVRTAGLPRIPKTPSIDTAQLLTDCLALANDLHEQMRDHFADGGLNPINLHKESDTASFNILDVIPSAIDEETLFDLCLGLAQSYTNHIEELRLNVYQEFVHHQFNGGYNAPLKKTPARPTSLTEAASLLNDVRSKYNWHRLAVVTHRKSIADYTQLDVYAPTVGPVQEFSEDPVVTPGIGNLLTFANYVKDMVNYHLQGDGSDTSLHHTMDTTNLITHPDATDLESLVSLIPYIRTCLQLHILDATLVPLLSVNGFVAKITVSASMGSTTWTVTNGYPVSEDTRLARVALPSTYIIYEPGFAPIYQNPLDDHPAITATPGGTPSTGNFTSSTEALDDYSDEEFWYYAPVFGIPSPIAAFHYRHSDNYADQLFGEIKDPIKSGTVVPLEAMESSESMSICYEMLVEAATVLNAHTSSRGMHPYLDSSEDAEIRELLSVFPTPPFSGNPYEIIREIPEISFARYRYAFLLKYQYKVGDVTYVDRGPVVFSDIVETEVPLLETEKYPVLFGFDWGDPSFSVPQFFFHPWPLSERPPVTITNLGKLENGANECYDVDNVEIEIYRTRNSGTNLFLLTTLANGTASYEDYEQDDTPQRPGETPLSLRARIYTTGGVVENDPPPMAKCLHVVNNKAYYGDVTTAADGRRRNRVMQSIEDDLDSVPATFYKDLPDDVVTITSYNEYPIVLCETSVHRLSSQFNVDGSGLIVTERIHAKIGAIAPLGVVQTDMGVVFAGQDGFYITDGFQVRKISHHLNPRYRAYTRTSIQRSRIRAAYDPLTKRASFAMQTEESLDACDILLVLDLNQPITDESTFTTVSGLSFAPSALCMFGRELHFGDFEGFVLKFDEDATYDVMPEDSDVGEWVVSHVPWRFESIDDDYGLKEITKWGTRLDFLGRDEGSVCIDIRTSNDRGDVVKDLTPIYFYSETLGEGEDESGIINEWQRFPSGSLRFKKKRMIFAPGQMLLASDGTHGTAQATQPGGMTDTFLLSLHEDLQWPPHLIGSVILYGDGEEETEGVVVGYDSDHTLEIYGDLPETNTPLPWKIVGRPKTGKFHMESYTVHYAPRSGTERTYKGDGE